MPGPVEYFNPTEEVIVFRYDGTEYEVKPRSKKTFDSFVSTHIHRHVNSALVAYEEGMEDKSEGETELDQISWSKLRMLGAEAGFYKVGMKKTEVIRRLSELR